MRCLRYGVPLPRNDALNSHYSAGVDSVFFVVFLGAGVASTTSSTTTTSSATGAYTTGSDVCVGTSSCTGSIGASTCGFGAFQGADHCDM